MFKNIFALLAATLVGFTAQAGLEAYAGKYAGKFEGQKGILHIQVAGSVLTAHFMGENGSTSVLKGCGSAIGSMLDIDMDGEEVDNVTFAFNPGECVGNVQGREMYVDFKHNNGKVTGANAAIYAYTTWDESWQCHPLPHGGSQCWPQTVRQDWYATGKFKK